jgi:hypothetical protein
MMRSAKPAMLLAAVMALSACGSPSKTYAPATSTTSSSAHAVATTPTTQTTPSALQAEATAAAAGDIPDNQAFIVFSNPTARYSMKYPEGWAQQGSGSQVTIRNNNNIVRVVVERRAPPSAGTITRELANLHGAHVQTGPQQLAIGGAKAFKAVYRTESAANAVTGKRVTLIVDRYYLAHAGKVAIVDLGSPVGVDNVDAYRLMIQSFRWR